VRYAWPSSSDAALLAFLRVGAGVPETGEEDQGLHGDLYREADRLMKRKQLEPWGSTRRKWGQPRGQSDRGHRVGDLNCDVQVPSVGGLLYSLP